MIVAQMPGWSIFIRINVNLSVFAAEAAVSGSHGQDSRQLESGR